MYAGERGPLMRIAFCVHHPCLAAALIAPPTRRAHAPLPVQSHRPFRLRAARSAILAV